MGKKGSGGSQSTQTVQTADPWVGAQPYLSDLYGAANYNFHHGPTGYYPGPTVAGMNSTQKTALDMIGQRALAGSPTLKKAQGMATHAAGGGWMKENPWATGAMQKGDAWASGRIGQQNPYANNKMMQSNGWMSGANARGNPFMSGDMLRGNGWATGANAKSNPYAMGQMMQGNGWMSGANAASNRTAMGQYLGPDQNPWMKGMVEAAQRPIVEQFQNAIAPSLASQFSMAGRTGSGSHVAAFDQSAATLGRQLSDTSSSLYGQAYQQERGFMEAAMEAERQRMFGADVSERQRQFDALSAERDKMFGSDVQERQRQFDALTGERGMMFGADAAERQRAAAAYEAEQGRMYGADQAGRNRQLQAFDSERARQLQAMGMAPQLAAADYMDLNAMLGAGDHARGIEQQFLDSAMDRWNYNRDEPAMRLANYNSIMTGAAPYASQSGTSTGTQQQPYNRVSGALGGGLSGAVLGPMLGLTGPMGALIGAGMGLFG